MRLFYTTLIILLLTINGFAQSPEGMSYQAIVRDSGNALVTEQPVGVQISILQGSATGTAVYVETHTTTTNTNGLLTLVIGTGSTIDDFSAIDWASGPYFIKTETDPTGGTNYSITAISQMLSVPYALYAKTAGSTQQATPTLTSILQQSNSAGSQQIKGLADPTEAQDAVTKNYTYSKEELDALMATLQIQIDALQAISGSGTVIDQDGNSYPYIPYGDQVWTVTNAGMVTYRDGTPIPQVTNAFEWSNLTTGAWCYLNNDPTKSRLYNWYAVMGIHDNDPTTPDKDFAPVGWHLPTDDEWNTLEDYLIANGYNYDGSSFENFIAKSMASTTGWNTSIYLGGPGNDQSLNNSSGFNAFPEGFRDESGSFYNQGYYAFFWSSTEDNTDLAWDRHLFYIASDLGRFNNYKRVGYSVRFVKDE